MVRTMWSAGPASTSAMHPAPPKGRFVPRDGAKGEEVSKMRREKNREK